MARSAAKAKPAEPSVEEVGSFMGFYKRFSSSQNADGGVDLVIGVPRAHKAEILELTDTEGEMLLFSVQRRLRPRLDMDELEPVPDDSFRVWTGQTDD